MSLRLKTFLVFCVVLYKNILAELISSPKCSLQSRIGLTNAMKQTSDDIEILISRFKSFMKKNIIIPKANKKM